MSSEIVSFCNVSKLHLLNCIKYQFLRPITFQYQEYCTAYKYAFSPTVSKMPDCMVIDNVCCGDGTYCPQDTTCQMYPYCCPTGTTN